MDRYEEVRQGLGALMSDPRIFVRGSSLLWGIRQSS